MFLEFPFQYAQVEGGDRLFYPMVKIGLKTIIGWRKFEFLVDTGADITTIPTRLLPVLGFEKSSLKTNETVGVGGISIKSWEFALSIKLGRRQFIVAASAVESQDDSLPLLLGRKDIFEAKHNLLLDSKRQLTVITPN